MSSLMGLKNTPWVEARVGLRAALAKGLFKVFLSWENRRKGCDDSREFIFREWFLMEDKCRETFPSGVSCALGIPSAINNVQALFCAPQVQGGTVGIQGNATDHGGIEFDPGVGHAAHSVVLAYSPRFDIPGPMMRTVRDPALSLTALSGVDPVGPVMVEVPPIRDNSALKSPLALVGWRIGFADEYVRGEVRETVEHGLSFRQALEVLRIAGAQLVPVPAKLPDDALYFTLESSNEIDECVTEHRLDALVSDGQSTAFHASCKAGYPGICVTFGEDASGTSVVLWFYGARWARDSLSALVRGYQQALRQSTLPDA